MAYCSGPSSKLTKPSRGRIPVEQQLVHRILLRPTGIIGVRIAESQCENLLPNQNPRRVRFTVYIDAKLRLIWPATPNMRYVVRWRNRFIDTHGAYAKVDVTYGSIATEYDVDLARLDENPN